MAALAAAACSASGDTAARDADSTRALPVLDPASGGDATRYDASRNAFSFAVPGLDRDQQRQFAVGDSFFTQNWVTAPASTAARDGLGPVFNAQACSSCHVLDSRGAPPSAEDPAALGLLIRLSVPGAGPAEAPRPEPTYGTQFQDRAVVGVEPEGTVQVVWRVVDGAYDDGTPYELRFPEISLVDLRHGPLADDVLTSPRLAPAVFGVGLIEAIDETAVLDLADPEDADDDGISGRPNLVTDPATGAAALGRFGWKASQATVASQVAGAFHGDIGITSRLHPDQPCPVGAAECAQAPDGGEPELRDDLLDQVVFYNRTLAVPAMRDPESTAVRAGAATFAELGCGSCHRSTMVTGSSDLIALSEQTIHPYTDLLLHDMGEGLSDGRPDFAATGREWRTPPLWGIGLVDDLADGERFLLHDGRARTLEEAILWHGGEGERAMLGFRALSAAQRAELITFLESL